MHKDSSSVKNKYRRVLLTDRGATLVITWWNTVDLIRTDDVASHVLIYVP